MGEKQPADDDATQVPGFHDVVNGDDVGMMQRRGRLRFPLEVDCQLAANCTGVPALGQSSSASRNLRDDVLWTEALLR